MASESGDSAPLLSASMATLNGDSYPQLLALERTERQLEAYLQALLDAQSEGLIAGLSGTSRGDASSDGMATPTLSASSIRPGIRTIPVRQPVKRKGGLRAARRGILAVMQELAVVKEQESTTVQENMARGETVLRQIDRWNTKRAGLEEGIKDIDGAEESQRLVRLKREEASLQTEIHELETHLFELKAKHRQMAAEVSRTENALQANLSSYQASLSLVDAQVREFLRRPPLASSRGRTMKQSPLVALPPKRRTLDMATEHWEAEKEASIAAVQQFESEKDALNQGVVVWEAVIREVNTFEKALRIEMQRLGGQQSPASANTGGEEAAADRLRSLLAQMDRTLSFVESKYKIADSRDWKLLVCCIGAELEAFEEGRAILQGALEAANGPAVSGEQDTTDVINESTGVLLPPEEPGSKSRASSGVYHDARSRSEDEDEDPDPELMISHQDTD